MPLYHEKFLRNTNSISEGEQRILKKTAISIVGLGGTGGAAFECLLRMGAENLILFDYDRFELTNFNRQLLATDKTLDKRKIDAAIARANAINKNAKIAVHGKFDARKIMIAKIVIDGTDNVKTHAEIARACRKFRIPYIFCAAGFASGIVSVFTNYKFEDAFQIPEQHDGGACNSIIAPAAFIAGSLAASETAKCLLKKPFIKAPEALFFNLFSKDIFYTKRLE